MKDRVRLRVRDVFKKRQTLVEKRESKKKIVQKRGRCKERDR